MHNPQSLPFIDLTIHGIPIMHSTPKNNFLILLFGLAIIFGMPTALLIGQADDGEKAESIEPQFFDSARQLTFEGKRAGEGYFSPDGSLMVFQSERRPANPFFQIYVLDFDSGEVEPISPGHGKTTCAWIHPENNLVLYASTQADPEAKAKQKAEIELREKGEQRRYSWDYDETFELFAFDRSTKKYTQLTDARGYDAEGSYSPDGKLIAFASNRNGYTKKLNERESELFSRDLSYMMDIFIMNADGSDVRQLTDVPGYDGGPFFSPDGKRICWRRFSENGATAEILTMNIDGTDQQQLTHIGALSWAPYYHPSGEYLIFTTNRHGFANFELYLVAANGKSKPVRVTDTDGFDGLASFNPDGTALTWTSTRNAKSKSQIFLANWNHDAASKMISSGKKYSAEESEAYESGSRSANQTTAGFDPLDIMKHVDFLCRKELGGRMTGSAGERKATAYVAAYFDYLGLKPAGDNGTWFQKFDFPNGAEIGPKNRLQLKSNGTATSFDIDKDWRPLTFSGNVEIDPCDVVFAGYGIVAPEKDGQPAYDSYTDLDVKDKWVMAFRFIPEDVSPEARQHFQFFGQLRKKAFYARDHGAKGLIIVSGPNANVRKQLVPLENDFSPSGSSIAAISISDNTAQKLFGASNKDLERTQSEFDNGEPRTGFKLTSVQLATNIDIKKIVGKGRNVIGRLQAGDTPSDEVIVVGAHIDHLGLGKSSSSLARQDEKNQIHFGADDNASGVAAMLEIAEYIANLQKKGKVTLKRDIVFAGWSGEELGLHGSKHFAESQKSKSAPAQENSAHAFVLGVTVEGDILLNGEPTTLEELQPNLQHIAKQYPDFAIQIKSVSGAPAGKATELAQFVKQQGVKDVVVASDQPAPAKIVAALNMDMVGRLTDKLVLQGISSSSIWPGMIESKNAVIGLPVTLSNETELPTDASSFYRAGIPILSAFTGSHTDYHTPRDTPEKLNYPDAARIARLMGLVTRSLATRDDAPDFIKQESKPKPSARGGRRAYLGSVPEYGDDVVGVQLSDVTKGSPSDAAGIQGGDVIVELGGKKIENIYDYVAILDAIKVGQPTTIAVMRDGKRLDLKITPGSRQ